MKTPINIGVLMLTLPKVARKRWWPTPKHTPNLEQADQVHGHVPDFIKGRDGEGYAGVRHCIRLSLTLPRGKLATIGKVRRNVVESTLCEVCATK